MKWILILDHPEQIPKDPALVSILDQTKGPFITSGQLNLTCIEGVRVPKFSLWFSDTTEDLNIKDSVLKDRVLVFPALQAPDRKKPHLMALAYVVDPIIYGRYSNKNADIFPKHELTLLSRASLLSSLPHIQVRFVLIEAKDKQTLLDFYTDADYQQNLVTRLQSSLANSFIIMA